MTVNATKSVSCTNWLDCRFFSSNNVEENTTKDILFGLQLLFYEKQDMLS